MDSCDSHGRSSCIGWKVSLISADVIDVDSMTKEKNYIYNSSDGQIVYVNAKGQLRVVDNNKITDIASLSVFLSI